MLEFIKYTAEDALYKALRDDPRTMGTVLNAADNSTINLSVSFSFTLPAKYAKYLLKEYIKNEIQTT